MSKGYFKEVLSIVQSVLILAKIFGYSSFDWKQTLAPTAFYILLWITCAVVVVTNKKTLENERKVSTVNRRGNDMTSVNEFTDDGK